LYVTRGRRHHDTHIGRGDSGMARDNGWRENPDIPAKEEEEEDALAKT
jgi:hypothetical protein